MQKSAKHFSERLNRCLDDMGIPTNTRERAVILGKLLHIPKQQAWSFLEGHVLPDDSTLQQLVAELEVEHSYFEKAGA